jgi:RNA polymerase-binding protein DksA
MHVIERNLVKMRGRLQENLQRMEEENMRVPPRVALGGPGASQFDVADMASEHFERENSLELYLYEHRLLKAIDEALARIKAGTYGTCAVCASPINSRRLLAVPNTKLCIRCQEDKEKNGVTHKALKIKG